MVKEIYRYSNPHLEVYGDKARYVEPISKKKAMELIEQGVELV